MSMSRQPASARIVRWAAIWCPAHADAALARKETPVQVEAAAAGFPTPAVRLAGGPETALRRAFVVMDRAEGAPLLLGVAGTRALLGAPQLLARIPATLAGAMADLHRLDRVGIVVMRHDEP